MANGNQFDPIAASASAALQATERSLNQAQGTLGTPALPAQPQAFSSVRTAFNNIAQMSPMNVLARGGLPGMGGQGGGLPLPGMQGQGGLPTPPGMQGQNFPQMPQQNFPRMPQQNIPQPQTQPERSEDAGNGTAEEKRKGGSQSRN